MKAPLFLETPSIVQDDSIMSIYTWQTVCFQTLFSNKIDFYFPFDICIYILKVCVRHYLNLRLFFIIKEKVLVELLLLLFLKITRPLNVIIR